MSGGEDAVAVLLMGPEDLDHQFSQELRPRRHVHLGARLGRGQRRGLRGRGRRADPAPPVAAARADRGPRAGAGLQRLHEHSQRRPDHGAAAAAGGRRGPGRRGVLLHRRRLVRRLGGLVAQHRRVDPVDDPVPGRRPAAGDRRDPRRRACGSGCGWSRRRSGCAARSPPTCRTTRSCSATAGGSPSTSATSWTCGTRPPARIWTPPSTGWSPTSAPASSSSTTT